MAINEHWGTGFEVNRDPNSGVRRDEVPKEAAWTRPTGRIGAHSATVHEIRPLTHELTIGGLLGLGGHHIYVPHGAQIHFLDGRPAHLADIHKGDHVAAIYHEVEHRSQGVADESGASTRYEAVHLLISPDTDGAEP